MFFSYMLVFVSIIIVYAFSVQKVVAEEMATGNYIIAAALFFVMAVTINSEKKLAKGLHSLFEDVQKLCGELSDMIDWTTMRKRQVYKPLEPELQESIDGFYNYCISRRCPFYGGKAIYYSMLIVLLLDTLGMFAFIAIALF